MLPWYESLHSVTNEFAGTILYIGAMVQLILAAICFQIFDLLQSLKVVLPFPGEKQLLN